MAAFIKEYFYLYGMVCFMWHGFDVLFMRDQSVEMPHKLFLFGLMPFAYFLKPFLSPYGLRSQGKYGLAPYNALFIFQGNTLDAQYFLTYD